MKTENKGKIAHTLQAISIIPLLAFGVAIMLIGTHWFTQTMYDEIEAELTAAARDAATLYDVAYPGDYHLEGETSFHFYKGDTDLTGDYSLLDQLQKNTNLDFILFYQDTCILTTLRNSLEERVIGFGAPEAIMTTTYEYGEPQFYQKAFVNNTEYFAYYTPLRNSDERIVGIIFVGKPSEQVNKAVQRSVYPLVIADIVAMLVISICIFIYTKQLISAILKIRGFMGNVSSGNLVAELDPSVLRRQDEFGDIGRSAIAMQRSLRTMIEQDTLTELFNRRSGNRKLSQIIQRSKQQNTPYCLAIGDIDFFKKVNDTYGHECGDLVLKMVSDKLREHMNTCGFVARWGGEEFLLVFDHSSLDEAHQILESTLEDIRSMKVRYNEHTIKVTMTFGLVDGDTDDIN
ncbi:MAG: diguanylate cyclase, partial [Acetatifactor sp.]|nr:diguanylate cyclase [Acetatifactor sp.]